MMRRSSHFPGPHSVQEIFSIVYDFYSKGHVAMLFFVILPLKLSIHCIASFPTTNTLIPHKLSCCIVQEAEVLAPHFKRWCRALSCSGHHLNLAAICVIHEMCQSNILNQIHLQNSEKPSRSCPSFVVASVKCESPPYIL